MVSANVKIEWVFLVYCEIININQINVQNIISVFRCKDVTDNGLKACKKDFFPPLLLGHGISNDNKYTSHQ